MADGPDIFHALRERAAVMIGRYEFALHAIHDPEKRRRNMRRALEAKKRFLDVLVEAEAQWRERNHNGHEGARDA